MSTNERVIILGAAGRDFHDFQVYWSLQPNVDVVCFTAKQIPGIDNRMFPPEMCKNEENGDKYPNVSDSLYARISNRVHSSSHQSPGYAALRRFAQARSARH